MRTDRSWKSVLASVTVVASLVAACGGGAGASGGGTPASRGPTPIPTPENLSAYPPGFPTTFTNHQDPPDNGLKPVSGGLQGHARGTLQAGDGTTGPYTSSWIENRVAAATVTCLGAKFLAVYIGETPEVTTEVDFAGWGHAVLTTVGNITVYKSSRNGSSPSVCNQSSGGTFTVEFTKGPVKQLMSGAWHWDAKGLLVFDAPAPSPSAT